MHVGAEPPLIPLTSPSLFVSSIPHSSEHSPTLGSDGSENRCSDVDLKHLSLRVRSVLQAGKPPWRCPPVNGLLSGAEVNRSPPPSAPPLVRRVVHRRDDSRECDTSVTGCHMNTDGENNIGDGNVDSTNMVVCSDETPSVIENNKGLVKNHDSGTNRETNSDGSGNLHVTAGNDNNDVAICLDNDVSYISGSPYGTMDGWPASCGSPSDVGNRERNALKRRFALGEVLAPSPLRSSTTAEVESGYYNSHRQQRRLMEQQQRRHHSQKRRHRERVHSADKQSGRERGKEKQALNDALKVLYNAAAEKMASARRATSAKHRSTSGNHRKKLTASESCAAVPRHHEVKDTTKSYETRDPVRRSRKPRADLDVATIEAATRNRERTRTSSSRRGTLNDEICNFIKTYRVHVPSPALTWVEVAAPMVDVSEDEGITSPSKVPSVSTDSLDVAVETTTFTITGKSNKPKVVAGEGTTSGENGVDRADAGKKEVVNESKTSSDQINSVSLQVAVPSANLGHYTVRYIKMQVEKQLGVSAAQQVLYLGSVMLRDDVPLSFLHPSMPIYMDHDESNTQKVTEEEAEENSGNPSGGSASLEGHGKEQTQSQEIEPPQQELPLPEALQQLEQLQVLQQQQVLENLKGLQLFQQKPEVQQQQQQQQQRSVSQSPTPLSRLGTLTGSPMRPRRPAPSPFTAAPAAESQRSVSESGALRVVGSISAQTPLNATQTSLRSTGKTPPATPLIAVAASDKHEGSDPQTQPLEELCDSGEMLEDVISSTIEQMKMLESIQRSFLKS
ncbi:uncharacterized protein TEOVI_000694100 [Trypanosoma equiperdum]|uniref:Ubiquitin-like domain-containing protein n=1 Tax=Trypanosoma equiperdum TaxID=5694 RepID=A0A1G4I245_TRYEQ|nr:hypothetical protein, conserved [Trypanosoma equiperdum]